MSDIMLLLPRGAVSGEKLHCRRRYTLHFCWFLEVHSCWCCCCCFCSCCCRFGWACSIEPKLTAILAGPAHCQDWDWWLGTGDWGRYWGKERRHKRHDDFNALSCSLCYCLSSRSLCPGCSCWLTRAQVQEFFSFELELGLEAEAEVGVGLDRDWDCDRGRK